jgi:hypothetical protein
MTLHDLPPIEDLHISVPHEECQPIGVIKSVVDPLGMSWKQDSETYLGSK